MASNENPVMNMLGRRIRLGVIGGGLSSFIGNVHRAAARLDDRFEIVASVLSSNANRSREQGPKIGISKERAYGSSEDMFEMEARHTNPIDAVAIMTPNHRHFPDCMAAISRGLHVICDKPLTTNTKDARELVEAVKKAGTIFCLTHNYSGYPMVRQAKAMIAAGELGEIRQVSVEYTQGHLSQYIDLDAPSGTRWRMDPDTGGPSIVLGDIGTHAHQLMTFVTGLQITKLCADVCATVPQRTSDDYASILMQLSNGAKGNMWVTQSASGSENVLRLKVFGSNGGLEWEQRLNNQLKLMKQDEPAQILTHGQYGLYPSALRASRIPTGHPEGFQEGFANLYSDMAEVIAARISDLKPDPLAMSFPGVEDGLNGMLFMEAALKSSQEERWIKCENGSL